jgi:ribosomal protein S13
VALKMQIDAHYYALLTLARSVGIEKETAHKIAHASQFVDDAKINRVTLNDNNSAHLLDEFSNTSPIINAASCHNYFKIDTFSHQGFRGFQVKLMMWMK